MATSPDRFRMRTQRPSSRSHEPAAKAVGKLLLFDRRYLELAIFKAVAGLRSATSRTYLNLVWWVIEPVLAMIPFYLVFEYVFERGGPGYVPFLLVGLVVWRWFANTINHCGMCVIQHGSLINRIRMPKEFFPTVEVVAQTIKFLLVFLILVVFLAAYGFEVSPAYLSLPLIMIVQLLFIAGMAYLVSAIVPFAPDLNFVLHSLVHTVYFLSGIFFSGADVPERFQSWFYANPMATLIEAYRDVLLSSQWPPVRSLLIIGGVGLLLMLLGQAIFRRFDEVYVKLAVQ